MRVPVVKHYYVCVAVQGALIGAGCEHLFPPLVGLLVAGVLLVWLVKAAHDMARDDLAGAWRPASEPPEKTEWVNVSANGEVRCVAWNSDAKQWEDWGATGIPIDKIDWWMPIPDTPGSSPQED